MTHRPNLPGAPSRAHPAAPAADAQALRVARLERILLALFRSLVREESTDPELRGVELVSLRLSPDGAEARIGYQLEEPGAERCVAEALARAGPFLRARLAEVIELPGLRSLSFAHEGAGEAEGAGRRAGAA